MTDPVNSDAALVREMRAKIVAALNLTPLVPPNADTETLNIVNEAWFGLSRLAAAVERADEYEELARIEHESRDRLEAALLVAQQERDSLMAVMQSERPPEHVVKFFQRLHGLPEVGHLDWQERAERAEATNTRLREALEYIRDARLLEDDAHLENALDKAEALLEEKA